MSATSIPDLSQWLGVTAVARALGIGEDRVRQLHADGTLTEVVTTPLGRLFNPEEVEFLRQERLAAAKESR